MTAALAAATAVEAGENHTCAVVGGAAKCWGFNGSGQLGDGTTACQRNAPVDVTGMTSGVAAIAGGGSHTCAVTTGGGVKCWGANWDGQLGDGSNASRNTPVNVSGLTSGVMAITAGTDHTCALTTGGAVKCWGANNAGQLGDGTNTNRNTPVNVTGLTSGVAAIGLGSNHSCAVTTTGGLKCWGANWDGQLGDDSNANRNTPVNVTGLASGIASVAGGSDHTCAVTTTGGLKCWGGNGFGQVGDGTTTNRNIPVNVSDLMSGVASVSGGGGHTCAVTTGGRVKCWGWDGVGQLGLGTITHRPTPVDVIIP